MPRAFDGRKVRGRRGEPGLPLCLLRQVEGGAESDTNSLQGVFLSPSFELALADTKARALLASGDYAAVEAVLATSHNEVRVSRGTN